MIKIEGAILVLLIVFINCKSVTEKNELDMDLHLCPNINNFSHEFPQNIKLILTIKNTTNNNYLFEGPITEYVIIKKRIFHFFYYKYSFGSGSMHYFLQHPELLDSYSKRKSEELLLKFGPFPDSSIKYMDEEEIEKLYKLACSLKMAIKAGEQIVTEIDIDLVQALTGNYKLQYDFDVTKHFHNDELVKLSQLLLKFDKNHNLKMWHRSIKTSPIKITVNS
jgi:hypothetical protein